MEAGTYCSVIFLDISQAFDKIWNRGLLYKIKNRFSTDLYIIIKSYLLESIRIFRVKYREVIIQLKEINYMPQDSVLEPVLYLLYIADLPVALGSATATYVDNTVVGNIHYPKKDMSTSNSEWSENTSSRRCQIFRIIPRSQAKLAKTYIHQA